MQNVHGQTLPVGLRSWRNPVAVFDNLSGGCHNTGIRDDSSGVAFISLSYTRQRLR